MTKEKKYVVHFETELVVYAENEEEAIDEAVEWCANDSEFLMPHNVDMSVEEAKGTGYEKLEAINDKD